MFATFVTVTLLIATAIQGVVADFSMPTPELTQCQDVHITWDQTKGPYNLLVVHSNDPCGDALADLGDHAGSSMTWKVSLPAGSTVELTVEDASGEEAWSGPVVIAASKDTSCLSKADLAKLPPSSSSSSSSSTPYPATTLSLPDTAHPAATPAGSDSGDAAGAINNAGSSPTSGALTVRQISAPVLAMSAFIGAITLLL